MEPGIYPHLSNEDYHTSAGISKSGISLILKCPELFYKRQKTKQTPAMLLGSATHTAILEPEKFSQEYIIFPKIDKRSKQGKEDWSRWQAENQGKSALDQDDYDRIQAMRDSVMAHPIAGEIFDYPGQAETSIYVEHEYTGGLCKVRPDKIQEDILVDLKTTMDASPDGFSKSCFNFDYHIQAGMYLKVCNQAGLNVKTFLFVTVENKEPYSVAVYTASRDMIEFGEQRFHEGMAVYHDCRTSMTWPGYNSDRIETIDLPAWAYKKSNFSSLQGAF